jgi:uncharacterized protein YecT (DUF1311 family)
MFTRIHTAPRRMRFALSIAALTLGMIPASASADPGAGEVGSLDYPAPQSLITCNRAARGNMTALIECQNAEYLRLDDRLNTAYVSAMQRQPNRSARLQLRRIQNAWLRSRWLPCQQQPGQTDLVGSHARITENGCHLNIVNQRIGWLETYRR